MSPDIRGKMEKLMRQPGTLFGSNTSVCCKFSVLHIRWFMSVYAVLKPKDQVIEAWKVVFSHVSTATSK